jgi:hypothetical protein
MILELIVGGLLPYGIVLRERPQASAGVVRGAVSEQPNTTLIADARDEPARAVSATLGAWTSAFRRFELPLVGDVRLTDRYSATTDGLWPTAAVPMFAESGF